MAHTDKIENIIENMSSSSSSMPHPQKDAVAFKTNLSLSATVAANKPPLQSTIFNVDDKDLVIIDGQDIHESTCNDRAHLVSAGSHHHHQQQQQAIIDKESIPPKPSLMKYSDMAAGSWSNEPTHEQSLLPSPTQLKPSTTTTIDAQSNLYGGRDSEDFPALSGGGERKTAGGNRGHKGNDIDLLQMLSSGNWSAKNTQWSESLNNGSSFDANEPKQPPVARKQPQTQPSYSMSHRNRSGNVISHLGSNHHQQQRPRGDADEAGLSTQTANKSTATKSKCCAHVCVANVG